MSDFLEGEYLQEQVDAIKELGGYITQLKRCGPGHGEYHFDKNLGDWTSRHLVCLCWTSCFPSTP